MNEVKAAKHLGQHFLRDEAVIARLLAVINAKAGERILEIGPGLGALTLPLLRQIGALMAVEYDPRVLAPLAKKAAPLGALNLIHADIIDINFGELLAAESPTDMPPLPVEEGRGVDNSTDEPLSLWERGWGEGEKIARGGGSKHPAPATRPAPQKLRLVGNLPYNLSSPILFHCLAQREHIHDMHYMLQKEVVDRITAAPGSKTYGRLSLMAQLWCETTALFDIPPDAFEPPPKVDSAVVRLVPRAAPAWQIDDLATFEETVRLAFAQRRKMLRKTFAHWMSESELKALDIDPTARAETLDGAAFARLANARYQQERQQ